MPIAEQLENHKIPFIFITGYESVSEDKDIFKEKQLLRKPILLDDIEQAIVDLGLSA